MQQGLLLIAGKPLPRPSTSGHPVGFPFRTWARANAAARVCASHGARGLRIRTCSVAGWELAPSLDLSFLSCETAQGIPGR